MKSWDPIWEEIYKNRDWGKYPSEELIRFIARNFYRVKDRGGIRILDLGCGIGANSWFIAREGFSVYGIDGSPTALEIARHRFDDERLQGDFINSYLSSIPLGDRYFDTVIDVEALSCNSIKDSEQILKEVYRILKPNGQFISIAFKKGSWGDGTGDVIDSYTYNNVMGGPCGFIGPVRFIPENEVYRLYSSFTNIQLEYIERSFENHTKFVSSWVITCRKPGENRL